MTTADDPKRSETNAGAMGLPFGTDHRYQLLVESIEDHAIYLLDAEGRVASWNRGAERILGYRADEIIGASYSRFFTVEDRAARRPQESLAHAADGGIFSEEATRVRKDGTRFWAQISMRAIRDDAGTVVGYSKITQDTTERRMVEAQRRMASAILDYSPDSIIVVNQAGRIERVNDRALAMFGYPQNALVGSHVELLLPERLRSIHFAHRDNFFARPTAREMGSGLALHGRRADGSEFPVDVVLGPLTLDSGEFVIAIVRDITDRKAAALALAKSHREQAVAEERARAGEALRRTSETLEKIVQASPVGIIALDDRERVTIWNLAAERMFELGAADILGRKRPQLWTELRLRGAGDPITLRRTVIREHVVRQLDGSLRRADGAVLEVSVSIASLGGASGRSDGFLLLIDDVTQQRATEEHLRQAQKMEAIGQLTGGIAHDFNNLLAIIFGNLELILERVETAQLRGLTEDALAAAERGASLTHRLLAYSRQQQLAPTLVEIDKLIRDLALVLRRTIEESIHLEVDVAPDLWRTQIDAHQLENSLINLAVNARDAMPGGGRLSIAAENTTLDEDYTAEFPDLAPGEYVVVSVSDNGAGMPKHVARRALEPFFTTKPVGRGTGLGLSMVYGFIKQSGGHLKIYSEPGHGTTVKLFLPRARPDGADAPHLAASEAPPLRLDNQLVLVIEDEAAVRRLQVRFLEALGLRAIEAPDGVAGLQLLAAHPDVDLILTDMVLPNGISGMEVASRALEQRPQLKIIFMSGYSRHAMSMPDELRGIPILSKPFSRTQLSESLARVFGQRPEP